MVAGYGWGGEGWLPPGWLVGVGGLTVPVPGPGDVGPIGCMTIPAAARCVRLIASSVAKLDLCAVDEKAKTPALERFLRRPNELQSWRVFRRTIEGHRQRYGNGFARAFPERRAPGELPERLVSVLPQAVQFIVPERGEAYYSVRGERVEVGDMLHLRDDSEDGLWGESKVSAARRVLEVAAQADESAKVSMRNLGIAKVAIELAGREDGKERQQVADAYVANHAGPENAGKPIVVSGGAKVHALDVDFISEAWIKARSWDALQCARVWGVPPPFVSEFSGTGGYGSLEVLVRMLWDHCLSDIVGEWDEEINRVAVGPYADAVVYLDAADFILGTAQEIAGAEATYVREGIKSVDEAREAIDLEAAPPGRGGFREVAMSGGSSGGSAEGGPLPGESTLKLTTAGVG